MKRFSLSRLLLLLVCSVAIFQNQNNPALIVQVVKVVKVLDLIADKFRGGVEAMINSRVIPVLDGLFDHEDGLVHDQAVFCICTIQNVIAMNRSTRDSVSDQMVEVIQTGAIPRM